MASRSERTVVATSNAPTAVGAYSQAIKANGMVFVSGQVPLDPKTMKVVEGDVSVQAKQSMENIKAILTEAGTSMDRIVKSTILLDDIANFKAVNDVYAQYFPSNPPARAAYAVKALPLGVQVEIECIALAD
ncbi:endoribonuclease L-PSP [Helicosporidium sp. ATCC 50920]|nr:endoribonuclease L-PSP [Helicosporidium sp. ATCC 50920]|eukprot:KDD73550.1 endoribonuclease L-PSP [Helicosporidium sp. ATCC 50920]